MFQWLQDYSTVLIFIGLTAAMVGVSLILMPILTARIPEDYFAREHRPVSRLSRFHPVMHITLRIGKNLLGVFLVLAGVVMIVTPGPGLLGMLVGFLMLDIPGKYGFEKWLVSKGCVRRSLNWLRAKRGAGPLQVLEPSDQTA